MVNVYLLLMVNINDLLGLTPGKVNEWLPPGTGIPPVQKPCEYQKPSEYQISKPCEYQNRRRRPMRVERWAATGKVVECGVDERRVEDGAVTTG